MPSQKASPRNIAVSRRVVALLLAGSAACSGQAAWAQDAGPDASAAIPEITVTAERRVSSVQNTPISMDVKSGEDLRNAGVSDLQGLSRISPSVSFAQDDGRAVITVRGISSRDTTEVGDPAVAVSFDNFYLNRPFALTTAMFDIERVEVLRGPQGTLYGRNATGGAINIISARPGDTLGGFATVGYGNYDNVEAQGALNVPITDTLSTRVSFNVSDHDNYRKTAPTDGGDSLNSKAVRGQVSWKPTDRLKLWALFEYNKYDGDPGVYLNVPYRYLADGSIDHGAQDHSAKVFPAYTEQSTHMSEHSVKWSAEYDLGLATLSYFGGYDETNWHRKDDQTTYPTNYQSWQQNQNPKTWNHEVRLASSGESPLTWQVGGFYFKENNGLASGDYYPLEDGSYARGFSYSYKVRSESLAAFGQAGYQITDKLKLTGGLRYTHDKKSRTGEIDIPLSSVYDDPIDYLVLPQDASAKWNKVTWSAGAEYQAAADNMLYAKVSTGYKAGGFTDVNSYNPEKVTSYEIGSKNRFLDGRLQLNLAAHWEEYKGQQVSQIVAVEGGSGTEILNAGSSRIYGIEADAIWNVTPDTRLTASGAWLHGRFRDFVTVDADDNNLQLSGNRLPNAPDFSATFGAEHDFAIGDAVLTAHVDTKVTTKQYFSFFNYDSTRQKSFMMSNARLTYAPAHQPWQLTVYVNNLENKRVLTNAAENAFFNSYHYAFMAPRTYGGRVTVTF